MTQKHLITPPLELLKHWEEQHFDEGENYDVMLIQAYQAGADRELEACCEWLVREGHEYEHVALRDARRPKPLSLKETLLARVARIPGEGADTAYLHHWLENESQRLVEALHKAIKSLPD
jgi:hypothetical protein